MLINIVLSRDLISSNLMWLFVHHTWLRKWPPLSYSLCDNDTHARQALPRMDSLTGFYQCIIATAIKHWRFSFRHSFYFTTTFLVFLFLQSRNFYTQASLGFVIEFAYLGSAGIHICISISVSLSWCDTCSAQNNGKIAISTVLIKSCFEGGMI